MDFDIGMFLNIGEDHIGPLEHTDFEDYFSCKLQLMEHCRTAIVNGRWTTHSGCWSAHAPCTAGADLWQVGNCRFG